MRYISFHQPSRKLLDLVPDKMPVIPVLSVSSSRNTNSSCAGTELLVCARLKSFHALCMHDDALDGMLTEAS
jgi:hypothetical protein